MKKKLLPKSIRLSKDEMRSVTLAAAQAHKTVHAWMRDTIIAATRSDDTIARFTRKLDNMESVLVGGTEALFRAIEESLALRDIQELIAGEVPENATSLWRDRPYFYNDNRSVTLTHQAHYPCKIVATSWLGSQASWPSCETMIGDTIIAQGSPAVAMAALVGQVTGHGVNVLVRCARDVHEEPTRLKPRTPIATIMVAR